MSVVVIGTKAKRTLANELFENHIERKLAKLSILYCREDSLGGDEVYDAIISEQRSEKVNVDSYYDVDAAEKLWRTNRVQFMERMQSALEEAIAKSNVLTDVGFCSASQLCKAQQLLEHYTLISKLYSEPYLSQLVGLYEQAVTVTRNMPLAKCISELIEKNL